MGWRKNIVGWSNNKMQIELMKYEDGNYRLEWYYFKGNYDDGPTSSSPSSEWFKTKEEALKYIRERFNIVVKW